MRIGFAATIRRLKGLSVLIAALDRLPALGVDAEVLVAGDFADPDYEREIRAQVAARPRPDERLRWLGHQRDLAAFRAQCDILVFPSVGDEGRPLVALEAMADGLPIVAAAVPGVTDLVRHDDTGILFAPRDPAALAAAIARVWREPELAERCARNAYAYVSQRHDKRRMIAETCRVYQEVLGAAATATRR